MVAPFTYPHGNKYPRLPDGELAPVGIALGLYIYLWNGINEGEDRRDLGDCGFDGPLIGPIASVTITYATEVKILFPGDTIDPLYITDDVDVCVDMLVLGFRDDELVFDHCLYGDWTVMNV